MRSNKAIPALIIIILALIVLNSSFYRLYEYEQAIITQFGKPIDGTVSNPGLHVKMPFIHKLHRFEKRILTWDGSANEIPTADKKYIWLDTTARWRITDPLEFYQSVGDQAGIMTRLDDIVDSASRDIVSSHKLIEVVRNSNEIIGRMAEDEILSEREDDTEKMEMISQGRDSLRLMILKKASELVPQYGIKLVDVQIKRLNYVDEVREKVYERMISERQRIVAKLRSEGQGRKAEITGKKERELKRIQSEAYREAQSIKGKGDAEATAIYADSYGKNAEFYSFLKTLEIYGGAVGKNSRMIMTTDSEIYKYLKESKTQ